MADEVEVVDQPTDETSLEPVVDVTSELTSLAPVEGSTPAAAPAPTPATDDFNENLIPVEDLSLKSLTGLLKKHPTLAALDKDQREVHNFLYATMRRSAQLEDYRKHFATPESAADALSAAQDMIALETDFFDTNGGAKRVLERLYDMSLVRDNAGNVVMGAQGPQTTGAFDAVVLQLRNDLFVEIEKYVTAQKDEVGKEAIAYVRSLFGGPKPAAATQQTEDSAELPASVQQQLARLASYEAQDRERGNQQTQQYNLQLRTEMDAAVLQDAGAIMKSIVASNKLALNDSMQTLLIEATVKDLAAKAQQDPAYGNMFTTLLRKPKNVQTRGEIVKQVRQYAARHLPSLLGSRLTAATGAVIANHAQKQGKLAEQRSRANVSTSGPAPSPQKTSFEERLADRQKTAKRRVTDREILDMEFDNPS